MLCFNCNQALGNVRDSAYVLDQLREYLFAARPSVVDLPYFEHRARGIEFEVSPEFAHAGGAG